MGSLETGCLFCVIARAGMCQGTFIFESSAKVKLMQNKKRRGQQEQLQMPVSGEQAKSQYEKNGTVRDESIFCIEIKCQKSDKED